MSNEQQRVDVLRTLDAEIMSITMLSGHYAANALIEARAAVAELIEAGRELQAGMDENDTRPMDAGPAKRFLAADARHRAALARIGGAA